MARKKSKIELLKKRYVDYCSTVGLKSCCHIEREQGEDISIMTEIVFTHKVEELFPPVTQQRL